MNKSNELLILLNKEGLDEENFDLHCSAEEITQDEIDDIEYMKDRVETWKEMY